MPITLDQMLALGAFDGDSVAALRTLHAHFSASLAGCSLSLLQVEGHLPGECHLAGLVDEAGVERIANTDPRGQRERARTFDDALSRAMLSPRSAHVVRVDGAVADAPFARALGSPLAVLGVPVANAGVVRHWLAFGSADARRFDALDLAAWLTEVNLAANLVVRPLATRALRDETVRQRKAIEGIADVQRLLLPDDPPIRGLEYAAHWQPAETAAGDYYDLMPLTQYAPPDFVDPGADIWALMLADVSGHGAAAAMEAVQFDAILRTYPGGEDAGPAGALTYANRHFFSRRSRGHFLTALALLYRPDLRRATFVDAGHPPLLQRRGDHVVRHGGGTQIPLGVLRDHAWQNESFEVAPGDVLVVYTDGVVEARDANREPFGEQRLMELVRTGPEQPADLLAVLRERLAAHQGGTIGSDDQTVVVLRIAH
ncbi:PP2C family protein-serine/threonine phosphatase [Dokdonella sp.]|uniref:PP2C family protein-serine/threonine phosphatase n=1 Tax=Dokdonella sp. TaxID=2291710 RepID=UPI002F4165F3